jgi:hypothetical protein
MKKLLGFMMTVIMGLAVYNCDEPIPSYNMTVNLVLPSGFTLASVPAGVEIKILNTQTARETKLITDASGSVTELFVQGNYNISTSFTIAVGTDEYVFNGVMNDYLLAQESTASLALVLADNTGGFILKEIYFSGSKTPDAKSYYDDQFHEVYNNSNDTLYADGLCIGCMQQTSTNPNAWVKTDGTTPLDQLPITFHVWIIPGTGKEHPVYPGKSIVIAMDGINHKSDPNGNPNSPVNLGNADWEAYVDVAGKDIDAPGVPNMTMMYTTSATMYDWIHSVFGYATIIFRLPVAWQTYVANTANFMTLPGSTSSTKYFMVDKSYVIDGVEIVRVEQDKRYKRLPTTIDAGYTYLDGGTYCSKSVRRKAKLIVDGRVIYKDTNNSTEDFLHDVNPTPGVNPTAVEN